MFLFRIVFWLAVVVMLLPTEERQQAKLYETAAVTVERLATFCDRNASACAAGAEAWSAFLKKAEFGARATGPAAAEPRPTPAARNTLSRDDLGPTWRGHPPRGGA